MQVKSMKVSDLKYAPYNPRKIDDKELAKLKRSITEFGYVEPIVWNKRSGFVVGGNQRLKALRELEIEEVDVVVVDLDDAKEKALNVALNKISGEWDFPKLKDVLTDIDTGDFDIELTGFDLDEIENLITFDKEPEEDGFDTDTALEEIEEPKTKRGDIYLLGKHRLMCGDSTIKEDVEKLMDGKKADMVFTDPPYNTGMNSKKNGGSTRLSHMFNDSFTEEEWAKLLKGFVGNCESFLRQDSVAYICFDWRRNHELVPILKNFFHLSNLIVWDKVVHGLGSDYKYTYELINVCKKGNPTLETHQGEDAEYSDVWHIQRKIGRDNEHATKKPIELCERAIRHATHNKEIVLDLFGGSGSTLIAAEQLNRICYMMELDERYCDVIVKRWEEFTGKKAQLMRK